MDPNKTLETFLEACEAKDKEVALEAIGSLYEWIERGGFLPETFVADGVWFINVDDRHGMRVNG
jgi:hypothetical protein